MTPTTPPTGFYIVEQCAGQRTMHPLINGEPLHSHVFAAKDKIDSDGKPLPSFTRLILPDEQTP